MTTLKESSETIGNFMRSNECRMLMNGDLFDKFDRNTKMIVEHIKILEKDGCIDDCESTDILYCVDYLTSVCIDRVLTSTLCSFIKAFGDLVFNWNLNVAKNGLLEIRSLAMVRFVDSHFTALEAIEILKMLIVRGKTLQNWNPPSFELSGHYFQVLKDELTKEV